MNRSRPKARLSRAIGFPLTRSCVAPFERRPYPPGVHGRRRVNASDYQVRLLEKQRLRLQYDLRETQLARAFAEADRRRGKTGEILVALLELRLDAVVLRAGGRPHHLPGSPVRDAPPHHGQRPARRPPLVPDAAR
ncbi:hypothetical protein GCM10022220_37530 [Actinocatenispora rupis]|uniref:Small ribosomal subunit protein uS4 N-terminal domain-containing protein n=1 Tax=Actinocatenispora rupis TaxID=519421 RepID=A0A8J3NAA2_9ACTN|nr:hypothetical protein Aru02nite_30430 [Actinocatenispora rupis]